MDKMCFSKGNYFCKLCERLMAEMSWSKRKSHHQLSAEIADQIQLIIKQQSNTHWSTTNSDLILLQYLMLLNEMIKRKCTRRDVKQLKSKASKQTESNVKIVFFTNEPACWPSVESFYRACAKDKRFTTQLVYLPFLHVNAKEDSRDFNVYKERMDLPIIKYSEYNISTECPDIGVYLKPYDSIPIQFYVESVQQVIPRTIFIQYGFEIASEYIDYHFRMPMHYIAWLHIGYGELMKNNAKQHGYRDASNVEAWGSPRADYYSKSITNKKQIPVEWTDKIKGKTVFLWTPHHVIDDKTGTFLQYKDIIFTRFGNESKEALIFRPHPYLFGNLINSKVMSELELEQLKQTLMNSKNIVLDESDDYREAIYASEVLIAGGQTFILEFLYTGKPIIYTKKTESPIYNADIIEPGYYVVETGEDLLQQIDNIANGKDDKLNIRNEVKKVVLKIEKNGVGESIKNKVYSKLMAEVR